MTKYQSLDHTSLHMIECRLTGFISFKYDFLLSKLNHKMNNLRKVLDEASIEIAKVNKELHLSEIIECRSINDCLHLSRVHLQFFN